MTSSSGLGDASIRVGGISMAPLVELGLGVEDIDEVEQRAVSEFKGVWKLAVLFVKL